MSLRVILSCALLLSLALPVWGPRTTPPRANAW